MSTPGSFPQYAFKFGMLAWVLFASISANSVRCRNALSIGSQCDVVSLFDVAQQTPSPGCGLPRPEESHDQQYSVFAHRSWMLILSGHYKPCQIVVGCKP